MKSKLILSEMVENKDRYKSANKHYYPITIISECGEDIKALFTHHQISEAIRRGNRNEEDFEVESFISKLFNF